MNDNRRVITIPIWIALVAVVVGIVASRWTGLLVAGGIIALIIFAWSIVAIVNAKRSDPRR